MRILLIVTLLWGFTAIAQENQWTQTADGWLVFHPFPHAPYPHISRADGFKARDGKVYSAAEHYSDSTVAIFIPNAYSPRETVDYIVHFHGHMNHVSNVVKFYNLPHLLVESKVNAILVFPQGPKDVPDSGCGKLECDPGAFAALMNEITDYLVEQKKITTHAIGHVVLSAHSGGFKVTGCVLDHGGLADKIDDVLLFDASYGNLEMFANWCAASSDHRLISFHTKHLDDANAELMRILKARHIAFDQIDEKGLNEQELMPRRPIFITTDLAHDDVPRKAGNFVMTVRTSELEK